MIAKKGFSFGSLFAMMVRLLHRWRPHMRGFLVCSVIASSLWMANIAAAQQPETENAICSFEDGRSITARYTPVAAGKVDGPPVGRVWVQGNPTWTLFTEMDVMLGNTTIPTGAYTMYLLPAKKDWTLIVSKNTAVDAKYDDKLDLARAPMEIGQLNTPADKLSLYFGHTGPKKCEINVDFGKLRGWVEFREK
jgi:hypothetical protein